MRRAQHRRPGRPAFLLITLGSAVQGTAIMVATDMTGGIIDRFRTMAISRASVLTGYVAGSLIQRSWLSVS